MWCHLHSLQERNGKMYLSFSCFFPCLSNLTGSLNLTRRGEGKKRIEDKKRMEGIGIERKGKGRVEEGKGREERL